LYITNLSIKSHNISTSSLQSLFAIFLQTPFIRSPDFSIFLRTPYSRSPEYKRNPTNSLRSFSGFFNMSNRSLSKYHTKYYINQTNESTEDDLTLLSYLLVCLCIYLSVKLWICLWVLLHHSLIL